ncbi:unnamed protein product [Taenia asiatica]|uniref:Uncharacterized protein n=1 Tax=Taenia asiatica TaxID=60517 RepID=A0A0R3W0K1_TAEAS|nr:unnamed protein product [Taenia asiatica]
MGRCQGARRRGNEESLTIHCRSSPPDVPEGTHSHQLLSNIESSFSVSLTPVEHTYCLFAHQPFMSYTCFSLNHLSKLAQALDPRFCNVRCIREALRQILGISSFESQVCGVRAVVPESPTTEKQMITQGGAGVKLRQDLHNALVDEKT